MHWVAFLNNDTQVTLVSIFKIGKYNVCSSSYIQYRMKFTEITAREPCSLLL